MGVECRAGESAAARYRRRRPEHSILYRTVQQHLETWLAHCREGDDGDGPVPAYVEREFRRYLDCGIFARGFARANCDACGHDFLIAFSCQGRGVCPSCNARRMVATAAHLTDHVLPDLPVRQWVLAVPKRLRYFLQRDADLQGAALRLFLRAVEQCLRAHSPGSGPAARRYGRPPTPSTIPPLIRCSSPPRPSSSTSASAGSHHRHRRRSPVCDAGRARARDRPPARARPPGDRRGASCAGRVRPALCPAVSA